jgi:hypothetical protein
MGKRYMHFQPFFREIVPVLKYTYILPLENYVIPYPTDTTHPTLMPDREDLSLRENCNIKKGKTDRNINCKFHSSAIHSFGTVSAHRAVLLSDQGQSN